MKSYKKVVDFLLLSTNSPHLGEDVKAFNELKPTEEKQTLLSLIPSLEKNFGGAGQVVIYLFILCKSWEVLNRFSWRNPQYPSYSVEYIIILGVLTCAIYLEWHCWPRACFLTSHCVHRGHLRLDKRSHRRPTALRLPCSAEPSEPAGGCGESTALKERVGEVGRKWVVPVGSWGCGVLRGTSDGLAGEHSDVNTSPHSSGAASRWQRSHTRSCPFHSRVSKKQRFQQDDDDEQFSSAFMMGVLGCPVGFVILVVSERAAAFFLFLFPFPLVCEIIMSWWLSERTAAVFLVFFPGQDFLHVFHSFIHFALLLSSRDGSTGSWREIYYAGSHLCLSHWL